MRNATIQVHSFTLGHKKSESKALTHKYLFEEIYSIDATLQLAVETHPAASRIVITLTPSHNS